MGLHKSVGNKQGCMTGFMISKIVTNIDNVASIRQLIADSALSGATISQVMICTESRSMSSEPQICILKISLEAFPIPIWASRRDLYLFFNR